MSEYAKDPNTGKFVNGTTPGPGRPKGARNKLNEESLLALLANFSKGGEQAIEQMRIETPGAYVRVVFSLQPREIKIERGEDMTDAELRNDIRTLARELNIAISLPDEDVPSAPADDAAAEAAQPADDVQAVPEAGSVPRSGA